MAKDKYKISLGVISFFTPISSLQAFRTMIIFDLFLWVFNIYGLWLIAELMLESPIVHLSLIIFCEGCMVWSIKLDLDKSRMIKIGHFSEKVTSFVNFRKLVFFIFACVYSVELILFISALVLSETSKGDYWREQFDFVLKVADFGVVRKGKLIAWFLTIIALLLTGLWSIAKLEDAKDLLVREREDIIITSSELAVTRKGSTISSFAD